MIVYNGYLSIHVKPKWIPDNAQGMNAIWLILDSLSFNATPFCKGGPDTMPQLSSLAEDHAIIFTQAYSPGPASPSSHCSFMTGELPSTTGMHEASPYYNGEYPTIADVLPSGYESYIISSNPFLFNGLQSGFTISDDLKYNPVYPDAMHPIEFTRYDNPDGVCKYIKYIKEGGNPLKSLINALDYKLRTGKENHNYAGEILTKISEFISGHERPSFVLANLMDVHPPLDASREAIERFAPNQNDDLPIGVDGEKINQNTGPHSELLVEKMHRLYKAAIWDLDSKITPFIRNRVNNGDLVIVTADHGQWFDRKTNMDESRIHVPLLIISPELGNAKINSTVNLRSLPVTTLELLGVENDFSGPSLLDNNGNHTSITEFIHKAQEEGKPVSPSGGISSKGDLVYEAAIIKGTTRINVKNGDIFVQRGNEDATDKLRTIARDLMETDSSHQRGKIDYDDETKNRLRDLGYL